MTFRPNPIPDYAKTCRCCGQPGQQCNLPAAVTNDLSTYTLAGTIIPTFVHNAYYRDDVGSYPHNVYADWDVCSSSPPRPSETQGNRGSIEWWINHVLPAIKGGRLYVCQCEHSAPARSTGYTYCGEIRHPVRQFTFNPACPGAITFDVYTYYGRWRTNLNDWEYCLENRSDFTFTVNVSVINHGTPTEAYRIVVSSLQVSTNAVGDVGCGTPNSCGFMISTGVLVGCESASAGSGGGGYHISAGQIYNTIGTAPAFQIQQDFPTASYPNVTALINAMTGWLNSRAGLARFSTATSIPFISDRWIDAVDWTVSGFTIIIKTKK